MGSVSKEMEILKKNQKEMLENKNTGIGMKKKAFNELSSRLETAEERISDLKDLSIVFSKTDKRVKTEKNTQNVGGPWENN